MSSRFLLLGSRNGISFCTKLTAILGSVNADLNGTSFNKLSLSEIVFNVLEDRFNPFSFNGNHLPFSYYITSK